MKTLILYTADRLDEMLMKSNLWYLRHYESYFDEVYTVYVRGAPGEPVVRGRTTFVSLGRGRGWLDLLASPFRLYRYAKKIGATHFLTHDIIWSWWMSWALQLFSRAKIHLLPQFWPEKVYENSKRSVSIVFPIWLEKKFIWLSFFLADKVITGNCFGSCVEWLQTHPLAGRKVVVADVLVEALPPQTFYDRLNELSAPPRRRANGAFRLINVGGLQLEKRGDELIRMLPLLRELSGDGSIKLVLVGDSPERARFERLADELNVRQMVEFTGFIDNAELPQHLLRADAYVSPLTGTALREAALCGLPLVVYDKDWVHGLLKHEETAMMIPFGNYQEMAHQIVRLAGDEALRERLSRNARDLAWRIWSPKHLRESLLRVFEKN